jgi:hypothetical protein
MGLHVADERFPFNVLAVLGARFALAPNNFRFCWNDIPEVGFLIVVHFKLYPFIFQLHLGVRIPCRNVHCSSRLMLSGRVHHGAQFYEWEGKSKEETGRLRLYRTGLIGH